MRHRAVRVWWRPWRVRCACGCPWFPCPDSVVVERPPVARSLRLNEPPAHHYPAPRRPLDPAWNGPTLRNAGPLLTRGQRWRSRQGRR